MKNFLSLISGQIALLVLLMAMAAIPNPTFAATKGGVNSESIFYTFDILLEKADLAFTFNKEKRVQKIVNNTEERLAEAETAAIEGKTDVAEKAMLKYQDGISSALVEAKKINNEEKSKEVLSSISDNISRHQDILTSVYNSVPESAKESVEKAIAISTAGQEKIKEELAQVVTSPQIDDASESENKEEKEIAIKQEETTKENIVPKIKEVAIPSTQKQAPTSSTTVTAYQSTSASLEIDMGVGNRSMRIATSGPNSAVPAKPAIPATPATNNNPAIPATPAIPASPSNSHKSSSSSSSSSSQSSSSSSSSSSSTSLNSSSASSVSSSSSVGSSSSSAASSSSSSSSSSSASSVSSSSSSSSSVPQFSLKWGTLGTDDGQFNMPVNVAVDSGGNVYVVDSGGHNSSGNYRIQKFDASGNFISKWGNAGTGNGLLTGAKGIAIDANNNVYIGTLSDYGVEYIQKFDSSGNFIARIGDPVTGLRSLMGGATFFDIAVDGNGNIYVADAGNEIDKIFKYNSQGTLLLELGSSGSGDGQFNAPRGIAIDAEGNIYVADSYNSRVQKFDSSGNFLMKWGVNGFGDGQFTQTFGIYVDAYGYVYVTSRGDGNESVQKFSSEGSFIFRIGNSASSNDGKFRNPEGIAVDALGNIYVADKSNHRIQKFTQ